MNYNHQAAVDEFMEKAGQALPKRPGIPNRETRYLRAKLILEEAVETIKALGFSVAVTSIVGPRDSSSEETFEFCVAKRDGSTDVDLVDRFEPDLIEIIDGCCDISVVTVGTLSACGCEHETFQREVDASNLRKFGPGGHRREDGKWMKPPDWKKPDIEGILKGDKNGVVVYGG